MSVDFTAKVSEAKEQFEQILSTLVPGKEENKKEIKCNEHPYPVFLYQFKNPSKEMSTPVYRVETRLEFPPWAAASLYAHWNGTTVYRENLHYFHTVHDLGATSDIVYSLTKKVGVISPRDYIDIRGYCLNEQENVMTIWGASVPLAQLPDRKSIVRGINGPYGFLITPHPENPQHTLFTLIHNLDFKGSVPGFVLKPLISKIMVMAFDTLHKCLAKMVNENWTDYKKYREALGELPADTELATLDDAATNTAPVSLVVVDPEAPLPMPRLTEQQRAVRIRKFDLVEHAVAVMKGEKGPWASAKAEFEQASATLSNVVKPSW